MRRILRWQRLLLAVVALSVVAAIPSTASASASVKSNLCRNKCGESKGAYEEAELAARYWWPGWNEYIVDSGGCHETGENVKGKAQWYCYGIIRDFPWESGYEFQVNLGPYPKEYLYHYKES